MGTWECWIGLDSSSSSRSRGVCNSGTLDLLFVVKERIRCVALFAGIRDARRRLELCSAANAPVL